MAVRLPEGLSNLAFPSFLVAQPGELWFQLRPVLRPLFFGFVRTCHSPLFSYQVPREARPEHLCPNAAFLSVLLSRLLSVNDLKLQVYHLLHSLR